MSRPYLNRARTSLLYWLDVMYDAAHDRKRDEAFERAAKWAMIVAALNRPETGQK